MNIRTRRAVLEDYKPLAKLSEQLGYPSHENDIKQRLSEILKKEDHCVFVALHNELVVGWTHAIRSLRIESDDFVEIGGMIIDDTHRRRGIGKLLVNEVDKWALKNNCQKVRVRSNSIRKESHAFYQKIGFKINKEQKVYDKKLLINPNEKV